MKEYCLRLDPAAEKFYETIAEKTGKTPEAVMSDLLFRLAGDLSLSTLRKTR